MEAPLSDKGQNTLTFLIYIMALLRIALCLFPQNAWTSPEAPLSWGIYRNIPFAMLGLAVILLFYQQAKKEMTVRSATCGLPLS